MGAIQGRSEGRKWGVFHLAATTVLALSACGKTGENSQSNVEVDVSSNPAKSGPVTTPEIPLAAVGLVRQIPAVDTHNWVAETIYEVTNAQLKRLGKLIAQPEPASRPVQLARLVDKTYRAGPLRPRQLSPAYQDASLLIERAGDLEEPRAAAAVFRGPRGFGEALRQLLSPGKDAREMRVSLKTFGVEPSKHDDRALTQVFFELSGRVAGGVVQQRAIWSCEWTSISRGPPRLTSVTVKQFEQATVQSAAGKLFSECTEAVLGGNRSYHEQLAYSNDHWLDRLEYRYGIDPGAWLGVAVGDVNGDQREDLYICQEGGLPNRLYLQQPDGTAADASASAGVDWLDHTHAALFVDLDNDSDQDLVLSQKTGLVVMANDGSGRFAVATTKPIPKASPYALSAADFDRDGDLDIYVCCYSSREPEEGRDFLRRPVPYHDANNGGRNVLLRNNGQWRFQDVTRDVGLDQNNRRFSFSAAWEDYDNDGDLDLYVANDYGRNNLYQYHRGRFTDVAEKAGVEDISAGMSVSWSDYDNDGWMDLYVSNMFSAAGNRVAYQRRFQAGAADAIRAQFQRHARGNSLFHNGGDGTFRDASRPAGVSMGRWAWGSNFVDINNDGHDDIVVANGFITQEDPGDL